MQIRDRIKELRRVPARQLRPNPKNWRVHPAAQQAALRGVLAEIGFAGALLARELSDGTLELIDGHLRAETAPDMSVPVLVLDVSSEEADKLLVTYDPLSGLATTDTEALSALVAGLEIDHAAVQQMIDQLAANAGAKLDEKLSCLGPDREIDLPELYQIVVECADESNQRELFERLSAEGYKCRVLTL